MKLILREDVENLGQSGELVSVKDGYGRNFLLPRKLAVLANENNLRQLKAEKAAIEARTAKLRKAAEEQAKRVNGIKVKITAKVGEQNKLFGSVTVLDIAEALVKQGVKDIERKQLHLVEPIKTTGNHEVPVKLYRDVTAKLNVEVVAE